MGAYDVHHAKVFGQIAPKTGIEPFTDLVAEVTDCAARRLGVDAAILFADLLLPAEALGLNLAYDRGEGPTIEPPVRSAAAIAACSTL